MHTWQKIKTIKYYHKSLLIPKDTYLNNFAERILRDFEISQRLLTGLVEANNDA